MVNKFDRKDSRILLFCDLILYLHELQAATPVITCVYGGV